MRQRENYYTDVPGLGDVAVSRHALEKLEQEGIAHERFEDALLRPTRPDVPDGVDVVWRERDGLRIIILLRPTPDRGARLAKTVYRVMRQAKVRV